MCKFTYKTKHNIKKITFEKQKSNYKRTPTHGNLYIFYRNERADTNLIGSSKLLTVYLSINFTNKKLH